MNAQVIYFSPTGTSRTGAVTIAHELADSVHEIDRTIRRDAYEEITIPADELVVFGAPVYGGRLYHGCSERFSGIHGSGGPCIVTVTYGNRDFDDALLELSDLAVERGFVPVAAAALVAQHTYGSIQVGRPDAHDQEQDRSFARQVADKLKETDWKPPHIPGNRPYQAGGNGGKFHPITNESCVHCGLCVRQCPEQAIAQDCATTDPEKCISCFRCVRFCPTGARVMNSFAYKTFAKMFSAKLAKRRENTYYL